MLQKIHVAKCSPSYNKPSLHHSKLLHCIIYKNYPTIYYLRFTYDSRYSHKPEQ